MAFKLGNATVFGAVSAPTGETSITVDQITLTANSRVYSGVTSTLGSDSVFQGSTNGYVYGGQAPGVSAGIEKFPFSSESITTYSGSLTQARYFSSNGQSSKNHSYGTGGATPTRTNTIDKFAFASEGNATDVGDLLRIVGYATAQSSTTNGYVSAGDGPPAAPTPLQYRMIQRFPFATDTNAVGVGTMTDFSGYRLYGGAFTSDTDGYNAGGVTSIPPAGPVTTYIDKFPFAAEGMSVNAGDLTQARYDTTTQSSTTHGYMTGGSSVNGPAPTAAPVNTIDKFPFASGGLGTDVGDLAPPAPNVKYAAMGLSSTSKGYAVGGNIVPGTSPSIQSFPFASDTNATNLTTIPSGRNYGAGSQART